MRAVVATLGYVLSPDGGRVLMIRRDARPDDLHFGKYNGLGGKLEPDEDLCAGMRREIREEAGIECVDLDLAGTVSFPGFGRDGEHWFVAIFRIANWTGEPATHNDEGTLIWVDADDLLAGAVPLWEGDRSFLPLVFGDALSGDALSGDALSGDALSGDALSGVPKRMFHGVMPYADGRPTGWTYSTV